MKYEHMLHVLDVKIEEAFKAFEDCDSFHNLEDLDYLIMCKKDILKIIVLENEIHKEKIVI